MPMPLSGHAGRNITRQTDLSSEWRQRVILEGHRSAAIRQISMSKHKGITNIHTVQPTTPCLLLQSHQQTFLTFSKVFRGVVADPIHLPPAQEIHSYSSGMSSTQFKALCLMALVAACLVTGTSGASAAERSRKLLQRWTNPSSMQANQVRAEAATSQVGARRDSDPQPLILSQLIDC